MLMRTAVLMREFKFLCLIWLIITWFLLFVNWKQPSKFWLHLSLLSQQRWFIVSLTIFSFLNFLEVGCKRFSIFKLWKWSFYILRVSWVSRRSFTNKFFYWCSLSSQYCMLVFVLLNCVSSLCIMFNYS
jgi:hypothetical protein